MGRRRSVNKHLPRGMLIKHGAYYLKRGNKWIRLASEYGPALIKYAELVAERQQVTTVADAVSHYLESSAKRLSPSTLDGYKNSAQNLARVFGDAPLDQLKPSDVYSYLIRKGNVQANRDKALLSAAYTHARRIGAFSGDDPAKGLQYRNEEKPRDRYVTDEELATLLEAAPPKLACIARFIELTGMRQGDALRLKVSDLDDDGFTYYNAKSKKRQGLESSAELDACIEEAKRLWRRFGRVWLFESKPKGKHAKRGIGPYTPSGLRSMWRIYRARAGLADVCLHDLRAKSASDRATDEEAQAVMGHANPNVTRRHYRRKVQKVKPSR